jgi:hypothetical protein
MALLVGHAAQAQSSGSYRPRASLPYKELPSRDVKLGTIEQGSPAERSALPDRGAFCKSVKGLLRAAGKGFVPLRGAPQKSYAEDVTIWESRQGIEDFRCSVYSTRILGDYVYCVQANEQCSALQDRFHIFSSYLMESCARDWTWSDSRVNTYDPRRMVSATNDEGVRITFETSRAKNSYSMCDLSLSIELL